MEQSSIIERKIDKELFESSTFLLGPRKVGKSTYLKGNFTDSLYIDLLDSGTYLEYLKNPGSFSQHITYEISRNPKLKEKPIIIDEIQRIPILLNDVHKLIEDQKLTFILCGSSARKLVRGGSNMLGGRAGRVVMGGLSISEINNFNLLRYINHGSIPSHYIESDYIQLQKAYIQNYIQEDIKGEALVRNLQSFNRFLELIGMSNGEEVNFNNISREVGVDAKTVRDYYQILVDTLLGSYLPPFFDKKERSNILQSPKFYLFDIGIVNNLKGITISKEEGVEFGKSFEAIILNEILNYKNYTQKSFEVSFWRTYERDEVDIIIGDAEIAIEIKGGRNINNTNLKGLKKFKQIYNPKHTIVVSNSSIPKKLENGIEIIPYTEFVEDLWSNRWGLK